VGWGGRARKKGFYDDRSRNVRENKQKDDNLPGEEGETYTKMERHSIQNTRFLLKSAIFLSQLERSGTIYALRNVETRCAPASRRH
jgi:hypothetical protein